MTSARESKPTWSRWVGALALISGAVLGAATVAGGCGGKTDDVAPGTTDSGPDIALVETPADTGGPKDTGKVVDDSAKAYDVPGSLFDVTIPDVDFGDGVTSGGCYDCTKKNCSKELAACDADPRCRGMALCVLIDCKGSTTDTACLFSCAGKFDVTGLSDPIVPLVQAIGTCTQANCKALCPAPPTAGDSGTKDSGKADGTSTESGSTEVGSAETGTSLPPAPGKPPGSPTPAAAAAKMSIDRIDPKVIEVLQSFAASMEGDSNLSQSVIDVLNHE